MNEINVYLYTTVHIFRYLVETLPEPPTGNDESHGRKFVEFDNNLVA